MCIYGYVFVSVKVVVVVVFLSLILYTFSLCSVLYKGVYYITASFGNWMQLNDYFNNKYVNPAKVLYYLAMHHKLLIGHNRHCQV